jgi:tetratricopeptide (TPR) repeat protein
MAKRSKKKRPASGPPRTSAARAPKTDFPSSVFVPLQALLIVAAVWWIFWPVLHGGWLWDDNFYVTENPLLHDPDRLWKTWFVPGSIVNYFPIEATAQWAQWELWHNDTFGYHVTNVVMHLLGAFLVWRLFTKLGLRLAWLGGLLFAIHPVQVESVAWIAEFKNTLSLPPFLLAMCAWVDYEDHGRRKDYFLALGCFLIAMLCKSTMVAFPVVILLYAWWKRSRITWDDLWASTPFFVLSIVLGVTNVLVLDWFQQSHGQTPDVILVGGFLSRLALAGLTLSFYFADAVWPVGLLPMYPQWTVDPPSLWQFLPWPVFGALIWWFWKNRQGWGRHALLGFGFFFLNLAPFAGFVTNSFMTFTWAMDHFLYIALIGLIGLAVSVLDWASLRSPPGGRAGGVAILAAVFSFLAWESNGYAAMFIDQKTLWTYTLAHNPGAYLAYSNLGNALSREGRSDEAIGFFQTSVRLKPNFLVGRYNLGCALFQAGQMGPAMEQFEQVLKIDPNYALAYNCMGNILIRQGQQDQARQLFERAVQLEPELVDALNNLGNVLTDEGRLPEALDHYDQALRIDPDFVVAHNGRALVLAKMGRIADAIAEFQEILRLDPNHPTAQVNLEKLQKFQSAAPSPK